MKKYPYSLVGNIVCISSAPDKKQKQQGAKQQNNPLKKMFPWIEPRSKQKLSNSIIQESKYQQSQPFYISFNLVHSDLAKLPQLRDRIDNLLKVLTQRKKERNDNKQDLIESKKRIPQLDFLNTSIGYIFTGIAKTSITSHEIFETLFHTCEPNSQGYKRNKINEEDHSSLQSEDSNYSQMRQRCDYQGHLEEHQQVFNQIKAGWDFKYHSYEYFRFMNKSYQEIKKRYEKKLLPQQVQRAVAMEMFPYHKARKLKYFEGKHARQLDQRQYFDYFFELFKIHSNQIYQKIQLNRQPEDSSSNRSSSLQIYHQLHHLKQFDFQLYLANHFKDINVNYQAFQNMILHNRQRYNHIINNFPLKTRQQRVQLLNQLANQNTQIANKISLIPLCGQFKESSTENDQYLILQSWQEQKDRSKVCILKQIIDIIIFQTTQSMKSPQISKNIVRFNFREQSVFIDIFHYFFYEQEYRPFRFITYDPQYLQYSPSQIITPLFSRAIEKMLDFNKLPKTAEQQMLNSTPNFEINIYEKLQYILQIYREVQQKGKLHILCQKLTDQNYKFTSGDDKQISKVENQLLQSQIIRLFESIQLRALFGDGFIISMQNIRLRLLQLAIIKYEIQEGKKVFMFDFESSQPYNSSKLDHHKKLESILTVLMIKTGIINKINYIDQDNNSSQELLKEYDKVENSFIEFLQTLAPLKLKDEIKVQNQKKAIQVNEKRNPMPLSRYFQPASNHHLLFLLKSQLYCELLKSNNITELEIFLINQAHKIVIIKQLQRMNSYEYNFEDKKIKDFFERLNDYLQQLEVRKKILIANDGYKNEEKDIKSKIYDSVKNKMKPFQDQLKKSQQFYKKYQSLSKQMQKQKKENPKQISPEKLDFLKNFHQFTKNLQRSQLKFQKIYWQLFSNLYDKIAKYENENQASNLTLYYKILLYFCCSSKKISIIQLFKNPITLKWTAQQLQKKIFIFKNLIFEMILQQRI